MNTRVCFALAALLAAVCGCDKYAATDATLQPDVDSVDAGRQLENALGPIYTVDSFDSDANPADDLVATISQASQSRKRIILEIGGDW